MNFLNPFALIGLAAASIPVIIHLFNLKKQKVIEFSSLRFFKELKKSKIRNVKIRQIILLILRTLIIIFAIMALSDPVIPGSLGMFSASTKTSNVILVDNSASNDINDGNGNRLNRSKRTATEMLQSLKNGDEVAISPMVEDGSESELSRDKNVISGDLEKIKAAPYKSGLGVRTVMADNVLAASNNASKSLYILSDFQKNIIDDLKAYKPARDIDKIILVPNTSDNNRLANISLDTFRCTSKLLQPDSELEFAISIRNNGTSNAKGVITALYLDEERVAQSDADLSPGESLSFVLKAMIKKRGPLVAEARIENDNNVFDNNRFISLIIPQKPSILVAGQESTALFVNSLMNTKFRGDMLFDHDRAEAGNLASYDLNAYDAVVLTSHMAREADRIRTYVQQGGSLFLFADPDAAESESAVMLQKFGFSPGKTIALTESRRITDLDKVHPVISGIYENGSGKGVVESPSIHKYTRTGGGYSIISLNDSPILSEINLGKGRVIFSALPANTEWSDFPITGLFAAVVTRSLTYLSSETAVPISSDGEDALNIRIGEKYRGSGNYKVVSQGKTALFLPAAELPTGSFLNVGTGLPKGAYTVFTAEGIAAAAFSINHDVSESRLDYFTPGEVRGIIRDKMKFGGEIEIAEYPSSGKAASLVRASVNTELWLPFLYLALLCVVAEMIVQKSFKNEDTA